MEIGALLVGILALVIAIAAPIGVELLKRPKLEIEPSTFEDDEVDWTFATVRVFNRATMPRVFSWLTRSTAQACEATIEFRKVGDDRLAFPPVAARWSSRPEPGTEVVVPSRINIDPLSMAASASSAMNTVQVAGLEPIRVYSAARAAESRRWDLAAGPKGEEIAVAVLKAGGRAFAWGAESQAYPEWANPEWELDYGTYDVTIRVQGSGVEVAGTFALRFRSDAFSEFRLAPMS
jgi:hypothetical protein